MSTTTTLLQDLRRLGLSNNQAVIYLLLIEHASLRIQEIVNRTKVPRSSVYEALRGLFELGIAEEVINDNFKTIRAYPIGSMRHGIDEKILELKRLTKDLDAIEKTLDVKSLTPNTQAALKYYKDRSGARQLYWNTLRATNTVYVYSDWGRGRYVGMKYYEKFVAESRARAIKEKVLINPTAAALESIRTYTYPGSPISRTRLQDIRAVDPSSIKIKGDTLIYNETYAQIYLKNIAIHGFEVNSPEFVESQRSIFETIWKTATPISELL